MTYRDDLIAKRERAARIARELRDVRRRIDEIDALHDTERDLDRDLDDASRDVGRARARMKLPMLSNLLVASPCHERWEDMDGDDRARHCGRCDKDVFDLSAMTSEAAESLLEEHGAALCARFYRRADGTVMTTDCAVGARKKRIRNVVIGAGAAALSVMAGVSALGATATMGEVTVCPVPATPGWADELHFPDEVEPPSDDDIGAETEPEEAVPSNEDPQL